MSARTLQHTFEAIGTHWVLDMYGVPPSCDVSVLYQVIHDRIDVFTANYSRFRPDSLITHIAAHPGTYTLPEDARPLLMLYQKLYELSHGAVTPLIGTLLEQAGYDADYSLTSRVELKTPHTFEEVFIHNDMCTLTTTDRVVLDFGAAGKGYLVDIVAHILESHGISEYCVDAGSDMCHRSQGKPLVVGLENPHNLEEVIGTVQLSNGSLCASAGNRRTWGDFHHVIHPHTLRSVTDVLATWVLAPSTMVADGYATLLFFESPGVLCHEKGIDYCVLYADGKVCTSPNFPGELFVEMKVVR